MDSYDSAAAAARMDGRVGVEKPPIITLKFRFYYKERAGIFHGMTVLFSMMPALDARPHDACPRAGIVDANVGNLNFRVIMLKSHAALGPLEKMPALDRPCDFVPLYQPTCL